MTLERNIAGKSIKETLARTFYAFMYIYLDKSIWLGYEEMMVYVDLIHEYVKGNPLKRGAITEIMKEKHNHKYTYIMIKRIKESNWLKKEKGKFIFPKAQLGIAQDIVKGNGFNMVVKV
jgi:hypothetical protein